MKKGIAFLLICMLSIGYMLPVAAYHDITISSSYDEENDAVLVSGTIDSQKANIPLTLEITDPNGNFAAAAQTVALRNGQGVVGYQFEAVKLPNWTPGGDYTITVSGHYVENAKVAVLNLPGAEGKLSLVEDLMASDTPYDEALTNAILFAADSEKLEDLSPKGQRVFNQVMADKTYDLPETVVSEEEVEQFKTAFLQISADIEAALGVAEFNDLAGVADVKAWIAEYYKTYGFDTDSEATEESEKKITEFVMLVQDEEEYLERLQEAGTLTETEDIQNALYEAALLTTVSTQNDFHVIDMVKSFESFFPIDSMSEEKLVKRCEAIRGEYYDSYEEITEDLNKTTTQSSPGGSTGGGGRWGGSSGDSVYVPSVTPTAAPTAAPAGNEKFSDMAEAAWAKEAVNALSEKGIISGRGAGVFAPTERVTRAEMIKILLLAAGISVDETLTADFADVSADAWYAPYIATAQKAGLAQGADGLFMPDAHITRQDMAVLLYRAFRMTVADGAADFSDADMIAGYAKDAVSTLVAKGIVSGVGDNQFAPLAFANRAQAAQIVYNALEK